MNSVRIVADSGCDLSPDLAAQYHITLVPVFISFGQEMVSSDDLTMAEFWARTERSPHLPGTAAPSPGIFQRAFQKLVSAGHDVVCLTLPARHSATFDTAGLAAQEFGQRVRVVDSGSVSVGMGLEVLRAAVSALAGHNADVVALQAERACKRTSVIFVLDTLEWVRHSGRLARMLPLIDRLARSLSVKPVIELKDSEFRLLGVTRSMRGALQRLEDEVRFRSPIEALAAAHIRNREAGSELLSRLSNLPDAPPNGVLFTEAGPVFAAHAGPGVIGAATIQA